jgi:hypothetical protein
MKPALLLHRFLVRKICYWIVVVPYYFLQELITYVQILCTKCLSAMTSKYRTVHICDVDIQTVYIYHTQYVAMLKICLQISLLCLEWFISYHHQTKS